MVSIMLGCVDSSVSVLYRPRGVHTIEEMLLVQGSTEEEMRVAPAHVPGGVRCAKLPAKYLQFIKDLVSVPSANGHAEVQFHVFTHMRCSVHKKRELLVQDG